MKSLLLLFCLISMTSAFAINENLGDCGTFSPEEQKTHSDARDTATEGIYSAQ